MILVLYLKKRFFYKSLQVKVILWLKQDVEEYEIHGKKNNGIR